MKIVSKAEERALARRREREKHGSEEPPDKVTSAARVPKPLAPLTKEIEALGAVDRLIRTTLLDPKLIQKRPFHNRSEAHFKGDKWVDFVDSIRKTGGNMDPIDVQNIAGSGDGEGVDGAPIYQLIAGECRMRACIEAGFKVRAHVWHMAEERAHTLHSVENLKRSAKSFYDRGQGYKELLAGGAFGSASELAEIMQEHKSTVSEALLLANALTESQWRMVANPEAITQRLGRLLVDASSNGLGQSLEELFQRAKRPVSASQLVRLARQIEETGGTPVAGKDRDGVRVVRYKGKASAVLLPASITKEQAQRLAELVRVEMNKWERE